MTTEATVASLTEYNLAVWVPDVIHSWIKATITDYKAVSKDAFDLEYMCEDSGKTEKQSFSVKSSHLPMIRNTTLSEDHIDDLTGLSYLNEPSVLNSIKCRYMENNIYTYSGIVLASVNPYAKLSIYEPDMIQAYSGQRKGDLDPHLFAVAEEAFRAMSHDRLNQSIIISGESGAGKTVNAKYIMKYFAHVCKASAKLDGAFHHVANDKFVNDSKPENIEDRVLATNPILEAFGNAKTIRNDNSSRFGKYVEILFNDRNEMVGASIRTYLLEKTRVIFQAEGERNYHIFYQLCAGLSDEQKQQLSIQSWDSFRYLASGVGSIDEVDDRADFLQTINSMKIAGFSQGLIWNLLRLLAATLHLGNVNFTSDSEGYASCDSLQSSLQIFAKLLSLQPDHLAHWLTKKRLITNLEVVEAHLTELQAVVARDSLAKYLYLQTFEIVVDNLNRALNPLHISDEGPSLNFIGVLDIYGFEKFDNRNSFEQFCINYANEKLQHIFNQQVFRLEQELYQQEGIKWSFISFSDNQPCIDLIEGRLGLLALLDEQCRFPSSTDISWLEKIGKVFDQGHVDEKVKACYQRDKFGGSLFTVKHFAYDVVYDATGFLDKNRDFVPTDLLNLIGASNDEFVAGIVSKKDDEQNEGVAQVVVATAKKATVPTTTSHSLSSSHSSLPSSSGQARGRPTTGSLFKASLTALMETIQSTTVHYVRCIKPNEQKLPLLYDAPFVVQQLRACGILETIRISSAGYPGRWSFHDFFTRYRILSNVPLGWSKVENVREACMNLLYSINMDSDQFQVGKTRVFLRVGVLARLEELRTKKLSLSALTIQTLIKRYTCQRKLALQREKVKILVNFIKRFLALAQYQNLRAKKAAIVIESVWKQAIVRLVSLNMIKAQSALGAWWRFNNARQQFYSFRRYNFTILLACQFRAHVFRKQFADILSINRKLCCLWKMLMGRKILMTLRQDSKSVVRLQKTSHALEAKILSVSRSLHQSEERVNFLEGELTSLRNTLVDSNKANQDLLMQNDHLRKQVEMMGKYESLIEEMTRHILKLEREIDDKKDFMPVDYGATLAFNSLACPAESRGTGNIVDTSANTSDSAVAITTTTAILPSSLLKLASQSHLRHQRIRSQTGSLISASKEDIRKCVHDDSILHEFVKFLVNFEEASFEKNYGLHHLNSISFEEQKLFALEGKSTLPSQMLEHWITGWIISDDEPSKLSEQFKIILDSIRHSCATTVSISEDLVFFHSKQFQSQEMNRDKEAHSGRFDYRYAFWITNLIDLLRALQQTVSEEWAMKNPTTNIRSVILMQLRSDSTKLVEELYRAWLDSICRWFSQVGISCIMDYQGLASFYSEPRRSSSTNFRSQGTSLLASLLGNNHSLSANSNLLEECTTELLCWRLDMIAEAILSIEQFPREIAFQLCSAGLTHLMAISFNQLLLRKMYATWRRGVQIQYNLSQLEEWAIRLRIRAPWLDLMSGSSSLSKNSANITQTSSGYHHGGATPPLPQAEPLLQAVKLLQLAKTATIEDLDIIFDACPKLSIVQTRRILTLYVPDEFEDGPVDPALIRALNERCSNLKGASKEEGSNIKMTNELFPEVKADMVPLQLSIVPKCAEPINALPASLPPILWKLFVMIDSNLITV